MKLSVKEIDFFERDVRLRMPFRFGVVTLTAAPQAFVRARIVLENGKEAHGAAAELLAPKWFDKNPALSNEQNFEQLRGSMRKARDEYLAGGVNAAYGHSRPTVGLVENFGPALLDRAVLDGLCRALNISFYQAVRTNVPGIGFAGLDMPRFLAGLRPSGHIAARHTVGLLDPMTLRDVKHPVNDGLPETLEQVIARYGHRWFKLKVGGDVKADVARLSAIAAVLERIDEPYHASLDGNEQYDSAQQVLELLEAMASEPRLKRLVASIVFIEQPIKRQNALESDVSALAARKPIIIDESDDSLDAFPRARALGYRGVSSKTCKGIYKSLINAARCAAWGPGYFMSGEDLTIQAGLALQQDLALVSVLGLTHVERNGHHYVNGMAELPQVEQERFLDSHPDLYERSHDAVRLRIEKGMIRMVSLDCPGYASRALPEWKSMRRMP
ncbi:MAG TPA: enolase C-terminal domain-like protein [Burkholderiales bacterium]|jgi:L-alanine-DL-glutamate epimerase-like enolase superfamily enzyme|nr:enolase C-terminal domain-like protein [Burkholderiales bacterium]